MTQDTGYAPDRWAFDDEVSRVFDDMLARSIPHYEAMRQAVVSLGTQVLSADSTMLDLGTSRGETISRFLVCGGDVGRRFVGLEVSPPMLHVARDRFSNVDDLVCIVDHDIREGLGSEKWADPRDAVDLVTAVLTMMFVPVEYRQRILADIYHLLMPNGAFIMVEKVVGQGTTVDSLEIAAYYALKRTNGYTDEDIERKRLALEGVLVPTTAEHHIQALRQAGFREVDCFWRWMNFAGFVAVK